MIRCNVLCSQQRIDVLQRSPLLVRYPVLLPVLFLSGSLLLGIVSGFADTVFPALVFIGAPSALLCLSFAFVLGIVGSIVSIINVIEYADRHSFTGCDVSSAKGA